MPFVHFLCVFLNCCWFIYFIIAFAATSKLKAQAPEVFFGPGAKWVLNHFLVVIRLTSVFITASIIYTKRSCWSWCGAKSVLVKPEFRNARLNLKFFDLLVFTEPSHRFPPPPPTNVGTFIAFFTEGELQAIGQKLLTKIKSYLKRIRNTFHVKSPPSFLRCSLDANISAPWWVQ